MPTTPALRPRRRGLIVAVGLALLGAAGPATAAAAPPKRVVTLSPFQANTVAGLGVRPVAYGMTIGGGDRFSSRLRGVRKLPLGHPNGPNLEQLASLNPDLVLSSPTWRKGHATMRSLGMKVVEVEPTRLSQLAAATRRIGGLLEKREAADRIARRQIADVKAARRGIKSRPRVLLVLGVGSSPYAFLSNSWGGDMIRQAGGTLVDAGLRSSGGFARISNERIVQENPDIIIAVPHGALADIDKIAANLRNNPAWATTNAARQKRVYVSTGNSLLQAYTDPGRTIRDVRRQFLKN